ncbi:MAG: phosphatase PAP2 family protein [Bacteroidota bacterium]
MISPPAPTLSRLAVVVLLAVLLAPSAAVAQDAEQVDRGRFLRWTAGDPLGLAKGLTSRHAVYTLGAGSALVLFTLADETISGDAGEVRDRDNGPFLNAANEVGDWRYAIPAAGAVFGASLLTDDARVQDAAFTSLESALYGNVLSSLLKGVFGRARPREQQGPYDFAPFTRQRSFPSGHTTVAFAVVTPWVVYYPGPLTYGLLAVATGTAVTRVVRGDHWSSDVVGGAALGTLVGYGLANRHGRHPNGWSVTPVLGPGEIGLALRLGIPPR